MFSIHWRLIKSFLNLNFNWNVNGKGTSVKRRIVATNERNFFFFWGTGNNVHSLVLILASICENRFVIHDSLVSFNFNFVLHSFIHSVLLFVFENAEWNGIKFAVNCVCNYFWKLFLVGHYISTFKSRYIRLLFI